MTNQAEKQKNVLARPSIYVERASDNSHFFGSRPSVTYSIWGMLQYTDKRGITLEEVNALTSHAFYLNVFKETIHIGGPFIFAMDPERLSKALSNLGYEVKIYNFLKPEPSTVSAAIDDIRKSIDRGIPVVAWDIFHPEFGLIYGYDDEHGELNGLDKLRQEPLAYEKFGNGDTKEVCNVVLLGQNGLDRMTALHNMLEMAIEHGRTTDVKKHPIGEMAQGLMAYDAWIEAFNGERINTRFNAYNIAVYSECRHHAVKFLRDLMSESISEQANSILAESIQHYEKVVDSFKALTEIFPFPGGGDPKDPKNAQSAIQLLSNAKDAEEQGLFALEKLLYALKSL